MILITFVAVSWFTTDYFGRRPLLIGAIIIAVISLLGIGVAGTVNVGSKANSNALIALACIWVVAYASGVAPIAAIYQGETPTPRLRAKTNFISQAGAGMFA